MTFADTSLSISEVIPNHELLSTDEQDLAQAERSNTIRTFLSIVFDMNDLRLTATSQSTGVHATTDINLLESQSPHQPGVNSMNNTMAHNKFVFARKWYSEESATQDDPQACLANFFGNLPISSAILANHHPPAIQEQQLRFLSIPVWAMLCSNRSLDPGSILPAFTNIRGEIITMLQQGASWEEAIGDYPNVTALLSEDGFREASALSQWASSMVHSVKNEGRTRHLSPGAMSADLE